MPPPPPARKKNLKLKLSFSGAWPNKKPEPRKLAFACRLGPGLALAPLLSPLALASPSVAPKPHCDFLAVTFLPPPPQASAPASEPGEVCAPSPEARAGKLSLQSLSSPLKSGVPARQVFIQG